MTVYTTGAGATKTTPQGSLRGLVRHLIDNATGWTLYGSGDGTVNGGPGVDAWTSDGALGTATSWAVIQCPGGGPQILFTRYSAQAYNWYCYVDRLSAYSGGTYNTPPTSASAVMLYGGQMLDNSTGMRYHITAAGGSTPSTAGWALFGHTPGVPATRKEALAFISMSNPVTGELYPWVMYFNVGSGAYSYGELSTQSAEGTGYGLKSLSYQSNERTSLYVPQYVETTGSGWGNMCAPDGMAVTPEGQDATVPVVLARTGSFANLCVKGVTTFAQWPTVARASLDTYGTLARIRFGDLTFTWDGVSTPNAG